MQISYLEPLGCSDHFLNIALSPTRELMLSMLRHYAPSPYAVGKVRLPAARPCVASQLEPGNRMNEQRLSTDIQRPTPRDPHPQATWDVI